MYAHGSDGKQYVWCKPSTGFLSINTQAIFKQGRLSVLVDVLDIYIYMCDIYIYIYNEHTLLLHWKQPTNTDTLPCLKIA